MRNFGFSACAQQLKRLAMVAALLLPWGGPLGAAEPRAVLLATTTSTQDTGLLDVLVPLFHQRTGIAVKTIAVGSGQALAMGRKGEADVLLVHSPDAENAFMAEGHGSRRRLVMHNDFVILGPKDDPAGLRATPKAAEAFRRLAGHGALFLSRGDNSGTHAQERKLWKAAGLDPEGRPWYQQTGLGMGQTLSVASEKKAYTLADRGTYLAMRKVLALTILGEGDASLLNIYHVIQLDPAKFPKVNASGAAAFADFLVSKEVQDIIATFGIQRYGGPLFFADAGKPEN